MDIRMKRDEMLAALEARRSWAKALDAKNEAKHKLEEKAFFKRFRENLRAAIKWDYETARKNWFSVDRVQGRPTCPSSTEAQLDHAIRQVTADSRKHLVAREQPRGADRLHYLLTHDETVKANVCA
jgi:hypothetical protein